MLVQSQKDLTTQQFKQLFEILKKHPEQYEKFKKQIGQLIEFLSKVEKSIGPYSFFHQKSAYGFVADKYLNR